MIDNKKQPGNQGTGLLKASLFLCAGLIFLYAGIRFLFYRWNSVHFHDFSSSDLILSFLQGLRFDLMVIIPWFFIVTLIMLIRWQALRTILFTIWCLCHGALLLVNFIDLELVNFMGRRFLKSSLYLAFEGQTGSLLQYTFLSLMTFLGLGVFFFLCFWFYRQQTQQHTQYNAIKKQLILILALVPLTVIAGRGGFQYKPLGFVDAKILPQAYSHHLILNSSFTFLKSFSKQSFQKEKYFSDQDLLKYLNPARTTATHLAQNASGYNLVLVIVESLSREYVSDQRTPLIHSLIKQGVYFDRMYANGRRSIEGIASLLAGIPALMDEPFLNSEFATNEFVGLGHLLKKKNYHTSFFHGAHNGTMRFDVFTKASGFDHYFGKNEFPDQSQYDGFWGIYDEPFLKFSCDKMSEFPAPFATILFTLSSHHPYKIPENFKPRINEKPILETIQYADDALSKFMDCARKKSWFKNTIFIITADHTGPDMNDSGSSLAQKFEIPLIFYSPDQNILAGLRPDQFAQQIDLLPTLNDLFQLQLLKTNHLARSLYQSGPKSIALFTDQQYQLVGDVENDHPDLILKAIKQYFSEGLYDNRLYYPQ